MKKILSLLLLLALVAPASLLAESGSSDDSVENNSAVELENERDNDEEEISDDRDNQKKPRGPQVPLLRQDDSRRQKSRASSTLRIENRDENIMRLRERIASSTASSSIKRLEKLDDRLLKQREQMSKVRERLLEKETKIIEILNKIAGKIAERITILEGRGLDMTAASAKLDEATASIENLATEAENLSNLTETEITEENREQIFKDTRAAQETIRTLARAVHAELVDTIKEITKVLPAKTSTSTENSTI